MEQWWIIRTLLGKIPLTLKLLLMIAAVALIIGGVIHLIEPVRFPSLLDGMWWALVTISTVGYGDFVPESLIGRILATLLIFVGIGIMTLFITSISSIAFSINQSNRYGELSYLGENHLIVVGWNERSKYTIDRVRELHPSIRVVLIDESLKEIPKGYEEIHFVKGNSTEDAVLKQANIGLASNVLVSARRQDNEFSSDARTILTVLAIKCQNPTVYTIAELLTIEQADNAKRAGADECVLSTTLTGGIFVSSLLQHQTSHVIDILLPQRVSIKSITPIYAGKGFSHAMELTYAEGMLLIGILKDEDVHLHPPASMIINEQDKLIVIVKEQST